MPIKWILWKDDGPADPEYRKLYKEGKLNIGLGKEGLGDCSPGEFGRKTTSNHLEVEFGLPKPAPKKTIDKDTPLGRFL